MWQRFTERARKVVFFAQEEAQKYGEGYVSTEHVLLGLLRESCTATLALDRIGVDRNNVRHEIERQLPRSEARTSKDMTLTPRAKRVIDLAYDEARRMTNDYIGSEHLLLGTVREEGGLAGRVLAKLGVELEVLRSAVVALQTDDHDWKPSRHAAPRPVWQRIKDRLGGPQRQEAVQTMFLATQASTRACVVALAFLDHSPRIAAFLGLADLDMQTLASKIVAEALRRVEQGASPTLSLTEVSRRALVLAGEDALTTLDPGHTVLAVLDLDPALREVVGITQEQIAQIAARMNESA